MATGKQYLGVAPRDGRCPCKQSSWGNQRRQQAPIHSAGYLCPLYHLLRTGGAGSDTTVATTEEEAD